MVRDLRKKLSRLIRKENRTASLDVLTGYALWAKNYPAKAHNPFMKVEEQAMLSLLPDPAGKICLDLACGSGRYMLLLQANAARIYGLDYSADMLAQATATDTALALVRGPFLSLPFADETTPILPEKSAATTPSKQSECH